MDSTKSFEHRGFAGSVEISLEDDVLFGRILHIEDLINYEGNTLSELRMAFIAAVDDYITDFESAGKPIPIPFKGSFNVRTGPELHRRAALRATRSGQTLNEIVKCALETYLDADQKASDHESTAPAYRLLTASSAPGTSANDLPFLLPSSLILVSGHESAAPMPEKPSATDTGTYTFSVLSDQGSTRMTKAH